VLPLVEFTDPELVLVYDTLNPYGNGTQPDFYREIATALGAHSIVDLGCGTGLITCALDAAGFKMVGVDPARGLLAQAKRRDQHGSVNWILGGAEEIGTPDSDLAIMTGHVAQFFVTDESWADALRLLHTGLRPGGHLVFESRNPSAREWETWTPDNVWRGVDPAAGSIASWREGVDVRDGIVSYSIHHVFDDGHDVVSPCELRFRSREELEDSLVAAHFSIERVFGGWDRRPVSETASEIVLVAVRG
jgi:SAM-dependent methyltransferase